MAKVSPWTGGDGLPALKNDTVRRLVLLIWRWELAVADIILDGYEPIHDPLAEGNDPGIPLSGLQVKQVDIELQIKRVCEFLEQLLMPANQVDDPLILVRASEVGRSKN
jgi:hypothetical protein